MLRISALKKYYSRSDFFGRRTSVRALDGVSFTVRKGASMGVVGESGCGKSTLALSVLRLIEPDAGTIFFGDTDLLSLKETSLRMLRREMRIVLQDSIGSLNPKMRCGDIVAEPFHIFSQSSQSEIAREVDSLLEEVGLSGEYKLRFPHELSGGQRQRINIARAMALRPSFVLFDEPVSSLDLSVQAQVLNLIADLRDAHQMTSIMISHNLSVVAHLCDDVAVMYLGRVVECGSVDKVISTPLHPYTALLLSSSYDTINIKKKFVSVPGDLPSPENPPHGCHFNTRCPQAMPRCFRDYPDERIINGVRVSCHLYG